MPGFRRPPSPINWLKNRCLPLLIALIALIAAHPLFDDQRMPAAIYPTLLAVVPFLGVMFLSTRGWAIALAGIGAGGIATLAFIAEGDPERALTTIAAPLMVLFYGVAIVAIGRTVFGGRALLDDRIYGGIAMYLLVGIAFAIVHQAISAANPNAYATATSHVSIGRMDWDDALYFSIVSLTTVGYGDVVPSHGIARSAAMLESMTGVFMPAIFIARLAAIPRESLAHRSSGG